MRNITPSVSLVKPPTFRGEVIEPFCSLLLAALKSHKHPLRRVCKDMAISYNDMIDILDAKRLPTTEQIGRMLRELPTMRRKPEVIQAMRDLLVKEAIQDAVNAAPLSPRPSIAHSAYPASMTTERAPTTPPDPWPTVRESIAVYAASIRPAPETVVEIEVVPDAEPPSSISGVFPIGDNFPNDSNTFGEHLRSVRKRNDLKAQDAAALLDVSAATWSKWEDDHMVPVQENYDKILDLFPAMKAAPKPKVRDIPKPAGNHVGTNTRKEEPMPHPFKLIAPVEMPAPANSRMALIKYGTILQHARDNVAIEMRRYVADVVAAGAKAGLSIDEILETLRSED